MPKEFNAIGKICTKCGKFVALTGYYKDKRVPDGHKAECITCYKIRAGVYHKKTKVKKQNKFRRLALWMAKSNFKGATVTRRGRLLIKDGKVIDKDWWNGILIDAMKSVNKIINRG